MKRKLIVLLLMLFAGAGIAHSQVYVPPPIQVPSMPNMTNILVTREIGRTAIESSTETGRWGSQANEQLEGFANAFRTHLAARRERAALPSASGRATTFRPVAETLVPPRLAAAMTDDPQQQQQRQQLFEMLLSGYKQSVVKSRRPANDLADAAASFVVSSYQTATSQRLTDAQDAAVRRQMKQVIAADTALAGMDDRAKQEAFETLVILGWLPGWMRELGEQNKSAELVGQAKDIAREQLEEMLGTKLGRIKFTAQGIEF